MTGDELTDEALDRAVAEALGYVFAETPLTPGVDPDGEGICREQSTRLGHVSAHARAPMRWGASWCVCELRGCAQALGTDAGHRAQPDATMRHARK